MIDELRSNMALLAVTIGGTAVGLGIGRSNGRENWPVYLAVIALGGTLAVALHLRYGLSWATRVGLVIFALSHVAGGMLTVDGDVLYRWWLIEPIIRYDNLQHAWGWGFAGRATWEILSQRLDDESISPAIGWWTVALAAGALGAVNEIIEWILTLTIPGTDVGGYDNTARDLVANLVGGLAVGGWTARRIRDGHDDRSTRQS